MEGEIGDRDAIPLRRESQDVPLEVFRVEFWPGRHIYTHITEIQDWHRGERKKEAEFRLRHSHTAGTLLPPISQPHHPTRAIQPWQLD